MRVLITGVSGFVGAHLARHLALRGHEVWGTFIRDAPDLEDVSLLELDLLDFDQVDRTMAAVRPQAVVHLAGLSHVGESWSRPAEYFAVNVLGTERLLDRTRGIPCLVASSAEVYGLVAEDDQPLREDRLLAPQSPYALTKAAMERLAIRSGATVVRAFNIVGAGQAASFALPAFAEQLADIRQGRQDAVLRVGNLAARRDFVHIQDAVEAYETLLAQGAPGDVYNLGSSVARSISEMLGRLIVVSGVAAEIEVDPKRFRPVDVPLLCADASKLRDLGWSPWRDLDEALGALWRQALARATESPESGVDESAAR